MAEMCATCIFRPHNAMQLRPGRVREMIASATRDESAIVCHHTLEDDKQAVCRGFYELDEHGPTAPLQIATRLGRVVEWVP